MKIVVLLKETPDTEAKIKVTGDGKAIDQAGIKFIVNPYDSFAIEEAVQLKDKVGDSEVVVITFGPAAIKERVVKGLAVGADRGVMISNEGLENADSLTVSKVLAAAIKAEGADIVFAGKQGIDEDNMHVGVMTAELLGWPHVNVVTKFDLDGSKATVSREVEGGQVEVYDLELPAVIGAHKSLNKPRFASLPGIMKAKKKPLDQKKPSDFGLDETSLKGGIKVQTVSYAMPPEKPAGKVFKDEPVDVMVGKVVDLLREEAKVL